MGDAEAVSLDAPVVAELGLSVSPNVVDQRRQDLQMKLIASSGLSSPCRRLCKAKFGFGEWNHELAVNGLDGRDGVDAATLQLGESLINFRTRLDHLCSFTCVRRRCTGTTNLIAVERDGLLVAELRPMGFSSMRTCAAPRYHSQDGSSSSSPSSQP